MNHNHPIKNYMTKAPYTIGEDIALSRAMEMMREHQVRHLPVQNRGKLVGVLSEGDIRLALMVHPAAKDLKVGDIMTEEPYSVTVDCPLSQVAAEMARHKYGCAIVENDKGQAIGIFTLVDAVAILGEWLRKQSAPSGLKVVSS